METRSCRTENGRCVGFSPGKCMVGSCSDGQLMACSAQHNHEAFDELSQRYRVYIRNFVRRKLGDETLVEDVVQEIFLRLYRSAARFDSARELPRWLFVIAMNEVRRAWARTGEPALSLSLTSGEDESLSFESMLADSAPGPEDLAEHDIEAAEMRRAIEMLPVPQRDALLLRTYDELSLKEIAQRMHCPVSTVNSRLHHAADKIRRALTGVKAA